MIINTMEEKSKLSIGYPQEHDENDVKEYIKDNE